MRILLITPVLPYPLRRNGGAQRTELLRESLTRFGSVDVLGIGGSELIETPLTPQQVQAKNIIDAFVRQPPEPKSPAWAIGPLGGMARLLRKSAQPYEVDAEAHSRATHNKYHLIVSRYVSPAMQTGIDRDRDCPWILDFDDIDWQTLASRIADQKWSGLAGNIGAKLAVRTVKRAATRGLQAADAVWVTSREDAELTPRATTILPNIPFHLAESSAADPDNAAMCFIGDLQFPPNIRGLEAFFAQAWPQIRAAVSKATLLVAGRGISPALESRWKALAGVSVLGAVADVEMVYAQSVCSIVPVFFGGGTKIKVLESLQMNRACVVASASLRGYDALRGAGGVFEATAAADFAGVCIGVLRDRAKRDASVAAGRGVLTREFSRQRFDAVVEKTIRHVIPDVKLIA